MLVLVSNGDGDYRLRLKRMYLQFIKRLRREETRGVNRGDLFF